MNIKVTERQKELVNEIATTEGFKNYTLQFNQGSLKGDGYTGTITLVEIKDTSEAKVLRLVLKSAHEGDELRKHIKIDLFYERENFMYSVIFKEFCELQEEFKVQPPFTGTARYFGGLTVKNEECVVLENLNTVGFRMLDRKLPMDCHHVGAVMAQYGKVHALSYAMKKLKPETFEDRSKFLFNILYGKMTDDEIEHMIPVVLKNPYKIFEGNSKVTSALKRFADSFLEFFSKVIRNVDKYSVILHGDCWGNNIIFNYENGNSQTPSKVYILDWQLSAVGSPLLDLTHFFYTCSSQDCLDNYQKYLRIYHESLSEMLKQFGISSSDIMTLEELQVQWKIFAKYGMFYAMFMIKIMLTEQDEVRDLREMENGLEPADIFGGDISNSEEYKRRLEIVIDHMVDNGFV